MANGLLDLLGGLGTNPPEYASSLLDQSALETLRKQSIGTGLVNAALGYLAMPKNQNLGLGRILAGAAQSGIQGAQGVYTGALSDWETQQKIADMKRAKKQQEAQDAFRASIGKPNATRDVITQPTEQVPVPAAEGAVAPSFETQPQAPVVTQEQYYDPNKMIEQGLASGALDVKDYLNYATKAKAGTEILSPEIVAKLKLPTDRGQVYQRDLTTNKIDLIQGTLSAEQKTFKVGDTREFQRGDKKVTQEYQGDKGWVDIATGAAWKPDASADAAKNLDQATINYYSQLELSGDRSWRTGLARDATGRAIISAVAQNVPKLAVANGLAPNEVAANIQYAKGLDKTLQDRTKFVGTVDQYIKNMDKQMSLVENLAKKVDNTGVPVLNRWINAGRTAIAGDGAVTSFDTAIRGLAREHQRIVTGATSNAQLAVSAQATADEILNKNQSPDQLAGNIAVMREEVKNAKQSGIEEIQQLRTERKGINMKPTSLTTATSQTETFKDEKGSGHYEYNADKTKRRKVYD